MIQKDLCCRVQKCTDFLFFYTFIQVGLDLNKINISKHEACTGILYHLALLIDLQMSLIKIFSWIIVLSIIMRSSVKSGTYPLSQSVIAILKSAWNSVQLDLASTMAFWKTLTPSDLILFYLVWKWGFSNYIEGSHYLRIRCSVLKALASFLSTLIVSRIISN